MEYERAYAKINLFLDVTEKREDGYHNIASIMQSVTLYDTITAQKADTITLQSNRHYLPTDGRNLVFRAAEAFFAYTGIEGGVKLSLDKRIPVASGLGGGSSDAAATLRLLNRMYGTNLSTNELRTIGKSFGADIPFCIEGGTAFCEGIGEIITPLSLKKPLFVVISITGEGMSAATMYSAIAEKKLYQNVDPLKMFDAITTADPQAISTALYNVFEAICAVERPIVTQIKQAMQSLGALGTLMSGSGPSVFGIFENQKIATQCAIALKAQGFWAFHCRTV